MKHILRTLLKHFDWADRPGPKTDFLKNIEITDNYILGMTNQTTGTHLNYRNEDLDS